MYFIYEEALTRYALHKMGIIMEVLVAVFALCVCVSASPPPINCQKNWKKVGCFHDQFVKNSDRVYPYELVNQRDPMNPAWDGRMLNWKAWPQTLHTLACACAQKTKEKGYTYFALQFYGECWSGPTKLFARDGISQTCIGNDYKPCDDSSPTECVGEAFTNYVYTIENPSFNVPVDGKWSEWTEWSKCSKSCNGGRRTRYRKCDNPKPEHDGKNCVGSAIGVENCNAEACEPVCDTPMDIGIVLDSSTSVTKKNWDKTLKFVKDLTKDFKIGRNKVHFGIVQYTWWPILQLSVSDGKYWSRSNFERKVSSIRYLYGGTRTDLAIKMAAKKLLCNTCGKRELANKALLVLTDGVSSKVSASMKSVTEQMKRDNIKIVAVGVGYDIDHKELAEIATDANHVLTLNGYQYLHDPINQLVKLLCTRERK